MTKLTWKRESDGVYVDSTGRYRIERHVVDDRWDTGALVPVNVQWIRSEVRADGSFAPVDLHSRLRDAKAAAAAWLMR